MIEFLIEILKLISQRLIVFLDCWFNLSFLLRYLLYLLLQKHFQYKTLTAYLCNLNISFSQTDCTIMAINKISMLDFLKYPSFFGMINTTQIGKASIILYILHEGITNENSLFFITTLLMFFLNFSWVGVVASIRCGYSRSSHFRYHFFLISHRSCNLFIKCTIFLKICF